MNTNKLTDQRSNVRNKVIGTMIIAAIVLTLLFDLSRIHLAVAVGLAVFVGSIIDGHLSGTDGLYILLFASILFIASFWIAYVNGINFIELANDARTPYLLRKIPFLATGTGVWGLCLILRSLFTGRWHSKG